MSKSKHTCQNCGCPKWDLPAIAPNGFNWFHHPEKFCTLAIKKTLEREIETLRLRVEELEAKNQSMHFKYIEI